MDARQTLHLSEWVQNWLAINDDTIKAELLFEYLDDRIFFFGEILGLLHTPKNSSDLLDAVISLHPNVKWHTPGLLGSRLDWLMACGKVHKLKSIFCLSPIVHDDREILERQYRENLDTGEKGEQFVLAYEKDSLKDTPHLASRVRRVSLYVPRAGYDIQSYFPDGRLKFIEVKASSGNATHFDMTHNEWITAKRLGDSYFVYRVTNVNDSPQIAHFQNPSIVLGRQPLVWRMNYSDEIIEQSDELSLTQRKSLHNQLQLETLLQELPREESIFAVYGPGHNRTAHNRIYIKWEEEYLYTEQCRVCFGENKPMIRVGYFTGKYMREYVDIALCVDCFLKLRDLFL